nr:tyrosine-protein phosphatase [Kitasatospora sp. NBC_01287]
MGIPGLHGGHHRALRHPLRQFPSQGLDLTERRTPAVVPDVGCCVWKRHIAFERLHNFRDLGGHRADAGRTVRWGRLFRSDSLSKLRARTRSASAPWGSAP